MQIQTERHGPMILLKPQGDLNQSNADKFRERFEEAIAEQPERLVIDASAISSVDSRGLEILVEASEDLARAGKTLSLCATDTNLHEVLELTGLSTMFKQFQDVNEAIKGYG
jgi:anti-anti-sigma factor